VIRAEGPAFDPAKGDTWWTYWEGRFKLFNRPRPDFFAQVWPGNVFISASQTARKGGLNEPIVVNTLGDLHLQDPWSQFFPLLIRVSGELGGDRVEPNIDPETLVAMCSAFGITASGKDRHIWTEDALGVAQDVFYHALATTWSPAYRKENEAALRQDWPRVPIPADRGLASVSPITQIDMLPPKPLSLDRTLPLACRLSG
jgi:hypothetical protein